MTSLNKKTTKTKVWKENKYFVLKKKVKANHKLLNWNV